jgi:hypothetical protein
LENGVGHVKNVTYGGGLRLAIPAALTNASKKGTADRPGGRGGFGIAFSIRAIRDLSLV